MATGADTERTRSDTAERGASAVGEKAELTTTSTASMLSTPPRIFASDFEMLLCMCMCMCMHVLYTPLFCAAWRLPTLAALCAPYWRSTTCAVRAKESNVRRPSGPA